MGELVVHPPSNGEGLTDIQHSMNMVLTQGFIFDYDSLYKMRLLFYYKMQRLSHTYIYIYKNIYTYIYIYILK